MTTKVKVKAAFKAMKDIGISEEKTKPALKKLLKVFNKNWELIEEENYRVLADAIFEYEETETAEEEKKKSENADRGEASEVAVGLDGPMLDEIMPEEPERPLKRLRHKHQVQGTPSNGQLGPIPGIGALKIPKPEPGEPDASPSQSLVRNKGKQPVSSNNNEIPVREKITVSERPTQALQLKEPKVEPGTAPTGKQKKPRTNALIIPKDEPFTDDVVSIEPLAVVPPEILDKETHSKAANQVGVDRQDGERSETNEGTPSKAAHQVGVGRQDGERSKTVNGQEKQLEEVNVSERALEKVDIAASTHGEVKISLICNTGSKGHELHMPDLEAVLRKVTENCVSAYQITDPGFSVSGVMKQLCDYVVELGTNADGAEEDFRGQ